jgi:hypothetical protein
MPRKEEVKDADQRKTAVSTRCARDLFAGCAAALAAALSVTTALAGMLRFTYTDSTGRLTLLTTGGKLHVYNVTGCAGLFNNGDQFTIGATFTLNPIQTITSP